MPIMQIVFKQYQHDAFLNKIPDECPYCHLKISPYTLNHNFLNPDSRDDLEVVYKCTNGNCRNLFIAHYINSGNLQDIDRYTFISILHATPKVTTDFPKFVVALSPEFISIYNQAEKAELTGLDKIAGVGYRKALEFLTKDYLINQGKSKEAEIKSKLLGACINMIQDQRIQNLAQRAVWLGNDETHYVRKWVTKDISDLKTLIRLVVHHIDADLVYQETMNEMP
jgi:hypothetical protein